MIEILLEVALEFWLVFLEMAPYLLFGFLIAGLLSVFVSADTIKKHLGSKGFLSVLKASLLGIPLPLCSCGVIPVGASLRHNGASKGAATSFLISTPQTGVDSIFVTYSLLGFVFAVFRPIAALATGLLGGGLVDSLDKSASESSDVVPKCEQECCKGEDNESKLKRVFRYGFVTLPMDIAKPIIFGLIIAAVLSVFIPDDFFTGVLGGGIIAMIIMVFFGIPVYVCATASVPIAAALIVKGVSPGAALVFLMTGPATNAATISTINKVLGKKTTFIYLFVVAGGAVISGMILDLFFKHESVEFVHSTHEVLPEWFILTCGLILMVVLINSIYRIYKPDGLEKTDMALSDEAETKSVVLRIKGMSCSHCAANVKNTLLKVEGIETVKVDLKKGKASITGAVIEHSVLKKQVEDVGFTITSIE